MNLLLISNSTNPGEDYLGWPKEEIKNYLNAHSVKRVLFIPYAGVTLSYDSYEDRVSKVLKALGFEVYSIHHEINPVESIRTAEAIAIGGGNTFHLLREMQRAGIMNAIREKVIQGIPYLGWSAGSNLACPTMRTTNDMPIVEPENFNCLDLIPFQINPHYLDAHPSNHGGETREQRIEEFLVVNPNTYVVGLREATLIHVEGRNISLRGRHSMRIFKNGQQPFELEPGSDLQFLLEK